MPSKLLLLIVFLALTTFVGAKPIFVNYSTLLTDKDSKPRTDLSNTQIAFSLYGLQAGGSALWTEQHTVTSSNGFINVLLGSVNALPMDVIDTSSALWIEMQISGESPFSRQRITTSFYTISANFSDTAKFSLSAAKSDSLADRPASEYALKTDILPFPNKIDSSVHSDTAAFAADFIMPERIDSSSYSDTSKYATTALQLVANPTIIDSANVALKAVTVVANASTESNLTINGYAIANSFQYTTPITKHVVLDAIQGSSYINSINWTKGINALYPSVISGQRVGNFIPFDAKDGSYLKKITAYVKDISPSASPNVMVCLSEKSKNEPETSGWGQVLWHPWFSNTEYGGDTEGSSSSGYQKIEDSMNITLNTNQKRYYLAIYFDANTPPGDNLFVHAVLEIEESSP